MATPSTDIGCTIKELPAEHQLVAAERAVQINPTNRVSSGRLLRLLDSLIGPMLLGGTPVPMPTPDHLAVIVNKKWPVTGVKLTVGFLDNAPADLQDRILQHMNAWGAYCNVKFVLTSTDPQVRIARAADGYWSYLGTDILSIPRNQPTMNLEGFTMQTSEAEFHRVVRHETGHTLGFPHEHMRKQLVALLDRAKTLEYFMRTQGWSAQVVQQQVLTPLNEASIRGTPDADQDSIMCYQLPGSITISGQPIHGGNDIDPLDGKFAASLYPLLGPPLPPTGGTDMFAKILAILALLRTKPIDWLAVFKALLDLFQSIGTGAIPDAEIAEAEAAFAQAAGTTVAAPGMPPRPGARIKVVVLLATASVPVQVDTQELALALVQKWKDWRAAPAQGMSFLTDDAMYWLPMERVVGIFIGDGRFNR